MSAPSGPPCGFFSLSKQAVKIPGLKLLHYNRRSRQDSDTLKNPCIELTVGAVCQVVGYQAEYWAGQQILYGSRWQTLIHGDR